MHLIRVVSDQLGASSTSGTGTMDSVPRTERNMRPFDRITQRPEVMGGKACIRDTRVTVGMIVGQIGAGHSIEALLGDYPYLEREDILQAIRYAAWRAEERVVELADA
jgi:uncharacterized protein (DUF433 family)